MSEPLVVRISDLRRALDQALDAAEELLGAEVALDVDYYWHLPVEVAFDVYGEPRELTIGQVSDDLDALRDGDPEIVWHELMHLVGVLRALELAARPER